ncbi:MAG: biopolymer transporter ExbD [bacterium]|nr:biopolymer transporter ExbD [bacterium]
MQAPRNLRSGEVGFNMTPMIDVVFLLIIFFLVSSHLAKQEQQLKLPLPDAASGDEPLDDQTPRITINLLSDGQIMLAGREISREQLPARLAERLNQSGPDVEVRIRGDRSVHYENVEPILVSCAQAGVWNVTFAVFERKGK